MSKGAIRGHSRIAQPRETKATSDKSTVRLKLDQKSLRISVVNTLPKKNILSIHLPFRLLLYGAKHDGSSPLAYPSTIRLK